LGHSHSPAIREAAYVAGTNSVLHREWLHGPTSWAHADIVTHRSGKRQIVLKRPTGWRGPE
jgi:hypothetical protein